MKGVYFLIKGYDTIYIGQSNDIQKRLQFHSIQDYDCYVCIECRTKHQRLKLENRMISLIQPKWNRWIHKPKFCTQIRFPKKLAEKVKESAEAAKRSMNKEIELTLEQKYL